MKYLKVLINRRRLLKEMPDGCLIEFDHFGESDCGYGGGLICEDCVHFPLHFKADGDPRPKKEE